ncbi:antigen identified by monoclonal antibody Ki-67 [Coemansia sp. RSA 1721]|nr:antigen identified by monoclonal antibody Ki-67 [Coemansia sp. RSA 1721]
MSEPRYGYLVVIQRSGADGKAFEMHHDRVHIGRSETCDIRVQRAEAAELHSSIRVVNNEASTLINSHRMSVGQQMILNSGDMISIAGRSLRYEAPRPSTVRPSPSTPQSSTTARLVSSEVQPTRQLVFKSTGPATARRLSRKLHSSKSPRDPETARKLKLWHQHYSDIMQEQENKMSNNGRTHNNNSVWSDMECVSSADILSEEPPEMLYDTSGADLDKKDKDDVFSYPTEQGSQDSVSMMLRNISEVIEEPKPLRLLQQQSPERIGGRLDNTGVSSGDERLQDEVAKIMAEISKLAHGDSGIATPKKPTVAEDSSESSSSGRRRRRRSRSLPRTLEDLAQDKAGQSSVKPTNGSTDLHMYPPLEPQRASEEKKPKVDDLVEYGSEDETSRTTVGVSPTSSYSRSPTLMKQRHAASMQTPVKPEEALAQRNALTQTPAEFFSSLPRPPNAQISQSARVSRVISSATELTSGPITPTAARGGGGLKRAMSGMALGSSRINKMFKTSSPLKRTMSSSSTCTTDFGRQPISIIRPSFVITPKSISRSDADTAAPNTGYSSDEVPTEPEPDSDSEHEESTTVLQPDTNAAAAAAAVGDDDEAMASAEVPSECLVTPRRVAMLAKVSSTTRKSVRFGPALSPEVFDAKAPPSTPLRRGTPMQIGRMSSILRQSADSSVAMLPLTPYPKSNGASIVGMARKRLGNSSSVASAGLDAKLGSSQAIQLLLQPKPNRRRQLNQYFSALSALDESVPVDAVHVVESKVLGMDVDCGEAIGVQNMEHELTESHAQDLVPLGSAGAHSLLGESESERVKTVPECLVDDGDLLHANVEMADSVVVVRSRRRSVRLARKERRVTLDSVSQTNRAAILAASPPMSPLSPIASSPSLVVRTRERLASPVVPISPIAGTSINRLPRGLRTDPISFNVNESSTKTAVSDGLRRVRKEKKERKERRRTAPVGFGQSSIASSLISSRGGGDGGSGNTKRGGSNNANSGGLSDIGASIAAMAAALGEDVPTMPFGKQDNDSSKKTDKKKGSGNFSDTDDDDAGSGADDALPLANNLSPLNEHYPPPLGLADAMHMQLQLNENNEDGDQPEETRRAGLHKEAAEDPDSKAARIPVSIRRGQSSSEMLLQEQARVQARIINPGQDGVSSSGSALDEPITSGDEHGVAGGSRRHRRRTATVLETLELPTASASAETTDTNELDADDLVARRQRLRRLQERKRRRQTVAELKKRRSSWLGWMPSGGGSANNSPMRGAGSLDAAQQLSSPPRSPSPSPSSMPVDSGSAMPAPAHVLDFESAGSGSHSRSRWQDDSAGHEVASVSSGSRGQQLAAGAHVTQASAAMRGVSSQRQLRSSGRGSERFASSTHYTSLNNNNSLSAHSMYPPESWNKNSTASSDAGANGHAQQMPKKRRRLADYVASAFGRRTDDDIDDDSVNNGTARAGAEGKQHLYPPRPVAIDAEWEHIDGSLIPEDAASATNVGNSTVLPARAPEEPDVDSMDGEALSGGEAHVISPASQQVELHAAEARKDSANPEIEASRMSASVSTSAPRSSFVIPGSRVAARANRAHRLSSSTSSLPSASRISAGSGSRVSKPAGAGVSRTRSVTGLGAIARTSGRAGEGSRGAYARGAASLGTLAESRKARGMAASASASTSPDASASASTSASASAPANKEVHVQKRASATDARLDNGGQRRAPTSATTQTPKHKEPLKQEEKGRQSRAAANLRRKSSAAVSTGDTKAETPEAHSSSNTKSNSNAGKRKSLAGDSETSAAEPPRRMTRSRALSLAGGDSTPARSARRKTLSAVSPVRPRRQPPKAPATARAPRRKK